MLFPPNRLPYWQNKEGLQDTSILPIATSSADTPVIHSLEGQELKTQNLSVAKAKLWTAGYASYRLGLNCHHKYIEMCKSIYAYKYIG